MKHRWPDGDRAEYTARRKLGVNAGTFRQFIQSVHPRFQHYRHIDTLISVLQRVADGEINRLMVFMPPRHGKSETVSRLFSAYYLHRFPARWVGINSYAAELAQTLSRNSRDIYQLAGGTLKADAAAMRHWETGQGGGLWAAGVGGPITGKGFHLGIIDDPIKNAEEAASETIRRKQQDWYRSTFSTREEPGGQIVVIQTRWDENDLSGWLLERERSGEDMPERWHIVCMEAVKGDGGQDWPGVCTLEPDEREPGAPLCPERYPAHKLAQIRRRIGAYFWSALYDQRPTPPEGEMFKREWFSIVRALPAGCKFVRYWDKAGTQGGGSFTAGVLMARSPDGQFYVADVVRGQWSVGQREIVMKQTAQMDSQSYGHVAAWHEQEPGSGGKDSAALTTRNLAGFAVRSERATGDKRVRAAPFAAQAEAGDVALLMGDWNAAYLSELTSFPHGTNDDQVDGSSGGFNKLALPEQLVSGQVDWYNPSASHPPEPPQPARSADEVDRLLGGFSG